MAHASYGRHADRSSRNLLMIERQRQIAIEAALVLLCVLFAVALALRILAVGAPPVAEMGSAVTMAPALWPGQ